MIQTIVGGLFYIVENFKVNNIVIGKQAEKYTNLVSFLKLQQKKNIKLKVLENGDILNFDKEIKIEVLFPNIHYEISENKINNNSLVFKMYYKDLSILFTGDIEEATEKVLVNLYGEKLKTDILKVGHHGSKTSSTEEFINLIKPKIALIGVGKNNNFGHPNEEIIERLEKVGAKIYRTDEDGEISIIVATHYSAPYVPRYKCFNVFTLTVFKAVNCNNPVFNKKNKLQLKVVAK